MYLYVSMILNTYVKCYLACTVILGSPSGKFGHIQALFKGILTHIQNLLYPWYVSITKHIQTLRYIHNTICDALRNLVPFVQFKKRKKHPWRSVNFSKVAGLKLTLLHGCFLRFLNCTNGTKSHNASQMKHCSQKLNHAWRHLGRLIQF